jgi:hypothetical protein
MSSENNESESELNKLTEFQGPRLIYSSSIGNKPYPNELPQ